MPITQKNLKECVQVFFLIELLLRPGVKNITIYVKFSYYVSTSGCISD